MTKDTGGPEFPVDDVVMRNSGGHLSGAPVSSPGMTLRDWFAGNIAFGMAAYSGTMGSPFGPGDIADRSYQIADAMLEARKK